MRSQREVRKSIHGVLNGRECGFAGVVKVELA